jgi:hypothetical protein
MGNRHIVPGAEVADGQKVFSYFSPSSGHTIPAQLPGDIILLWDYYKY